MNRFDIREFVNGAELVSGEVGLDGELLLVSVGDRDN